MGVINNLIKIRNIEKGGGISEVFPEIEIENVRDTSGNSTNLNTNVNGIIYQLQAFRNNEWVNLGIPAGTINKTYNPSLANVTVTSICRYLVWRYGSDVEHAVISNEFTVTRTAAQTASLKQGNQTDLNAEDIAVETDVIKKEDKE